MKVIHLLKCIMIALFIGMNASPAMAQKNIDKVLEEIERRNDVSVNSVVKRDPKTRKIVSIVKSFNLSNHSMASKLIEAFEKDEEYTVTAIKDMPKGRRNAVGTCLTFIFLKDNEKRTYTLNVTPNGKISISAIIKKEKQRKDYSLHFDNDLNDMDFEIQTMDKEQIKELQKSIQKSLKGLKLKNLTQLEFDKLGCTITADELEVSL